MNFFDIGIWFKALCIVISIFLLPVIYYIYASLKYRKFLDEYCPHLNEHYANKANVKIKKIHIMICDSWIVMVRYKTYRIFIGKEYLCAFEEGNNHSRKVHLLNTIGHEIAHMKNKDQFVKFLKNNTDKMIHLLKEIRANIDGKSIIGSSEEDYLEYRRVEEIINTKSKEAKFNFGYPTEELPTNYAMNYSSFSMELIEKVFTDYTENMDTIDKDRIFKWFQIKSV